METWIKWQRGNCPMVEVHGKSVDNARHEYQYLLTDEYVFFAQWGVKTDEGNLVLGEMRRPMALERN